MAPPEKILNDSLTLFIDREVDAWLPANVNPGGLRVNSVSTDGAAKTVKVGLNENFTYLPVTADLVADMRDFISGILPDSISGFSVKLNVGQRPYSYYINTISKLPEQYRKNIPFVRDAYPPNVAKRGMEGDIIAIWPSHGRYYKPAVDAWMWQRPLLFECLEDTHTLSYVLPFVVPMIENAGGYVFLPRERDINPNEVIVDNDINNDGQLFSQPYYKEVTGLNKWTTGEEDGFIYDLPDFRDTENPFENGTYRQVATIVSGKPSFAAWYADIPEDGEYAVYVSYKTLPESTEDARYTVNYSGGSKEFTVNQTMGGGTWIYLGTFPLEAGYSDTEPIVAVSNVSSQSGRLLTADAVKIGGGVGNIARSKNRNDIYEDPSYTGLPSDDEAVNDEAGDESDSAENIALDETALEEEQGNVAPELSKNSANQQKFKTSGLPRFLEGARYWLHWAGIPEDVYSPTHGEDDYKDDYTGRSIWVNYLAGGSRVLPDRHGLGIPVDAAFALHSDAGKRADDTFVGTLGIFYTEGGGNYTDGTPRTDSRTLTDMLMRQITGDIRQIWEPQWTRRQMWDKSYVEARVPEVPTSLIELLSHQNFADMRYAHDPAFRFTVGRSIYKAIGRFVAERKDRKFTVQPLPVKNFAIKKQKARHYRLSWDPTPDRLEPTAMPTGYLVYERTADELGFHLLGKTSSTHFEIEVDDRDIHSFRIVAVNDGGRSFPSETLALCEGNGTPVLVVNGFTRVSGPAEINEGDLAGFRSGEDFGVPFLRDMMFTGVQTELHRSAGESFGRSEGNMASKIIAGNTFDYPYVHGKAIVAAGRGFVSCSAGAVENGYVNLKDYKTIDLILGKQKTTVTGNGNSGIRYEAFPKRLQEELTSFTRHGGALFVSGMYVASDLLDSRSAAGSGDFRSEVLGLGVPGGAIGATGSIMPEKGAGVILNTAGIINYNSTLNDKKYIVENPDNLTPSHGRNPECFLRFNGNGGIAGLSYRSSGRGVAVMSIPFESIEGHSQAPLMKAILDYIEK